MARVEYDEDLTDEQAICELIAKRGYHCVPPDEAEPRKQAPRTAGHLGHDAQISPVTVDFFGLEVIKSEAARNWLMLLLSTPSHLSGTR